MSETLSRCATCRFAEWDKASNGRRHPSGAGTCTYQLPDVSLPKWAHGWDWGHKQQITNVSALVAKHGGARHIWYRESTVVECPTWGRITS